MQCVLLAGGLGTRMRPMTEFVPKAMLDVGGRPFADRQLTLLARQGYRRIVYCIGHRGQVLRDFVGDGSSWGMHITYSDEGANLRGTAGALRQASDAGLLDAEFTVIYGDSYLTVDPGPMRRAFQLAPQPVVMAVWRNHGQLAPSNVQYESGSPVVYRKAAPTAAMHHIDYGLTMIRRHVIDDRVDPDLVMDLAALVEDLSAQGEVGGFEVADRFYEVGSPEGLAQLEQYLAAHGESTMGSPPPGP